MTTEATEFDPSRAEQLIQHLLAAGTLTAAHLQPCSAADLETLEATYNVRLPEAYRYYLRRLGRGAAALFEPRGWFADYAAVVEMGQAFHEGFGDRVEVPSSYFCFAVLGADLFLFLPADGSHPDPAVVGWSEEWSESGQFEEAYPSFWDWFAEVAAENAR